MMVAAWYAVASINISGIRATDFSASNVINEHCPLHLVPPGWMPGKDQMHILLSWPAIETKARLMALAVVWAVSIFALIRWRSRKQNDGVLHTE